MKTLKRIVVVGLLGAVVAFVACKKPQPMEWRGLPLEGARVCSNPAKWSTDFKCIVDDVAFTCIQDKYIVTCARISP